MKRSVAVAALCSVALVSVAAWSQSATVSLVKTGTPNTIAISGNGGTKTETLRTDDPIRRLRFSESADRPAFVGVMAWSQKDDEEEIWGEAHSGSMKTLELAAGNNRAFHGLQVCMNADKTRIKGVRAFASEFEWSGATAKPVRRAALKEEFVRPNCDEKNGWMQVRLCPVGQVMVGVKVEYDQTPYKTATGLAPTCQEMTMRKVVTN